MEFFSGLRERLTVFAVLSCAGLTLGGEAASRLGLLSLPASALLWTGAAILLAALLTGPLRSSSASHGTDRTDPKSPPLTPSERLLAMSVAFLLVLSLVAGLLFVPSSWDAMVYHLPRQIRWIQQGSFEHFATHDTQQLFRSPLADMLSAQLLLIGGRDSLSSLIQWTAMLFNLAVVSMIARQLGADRRGQLLAAFLCISVPVAFLQASNSKNDVLFALWITILTWLGLRVAQNRRCSLFEAALAGCAAGLLLLSKGTGLFLGLFPLAFLAIAIIRARGKGFYKAALLAAGLAILINVGHWERNLSLFGTPFTPSSDRAAFQNQAVSPGLLLSRTLREASLHLGTPWGGLNQWLQDAVVGLHRGLGLDIDDPRTTYAGLEFRIAYAPADEYQAGAPVHWMATLIAAGALLILRRRLRRPLPLAIVLLPFLLVASMCLLLKWSYVYGSRFHLAALFLGAALAGRLFTLPQLRRWALAAALPAFLWLIPTLTRNPRSLLPPTLALRPADEQLLTFQSHRLADFRRAADFVRSLNPSLVGIESRASSHYEYPLMRLIGRDLLRPTFVAFDVRNVSKGLESRSRPPDVVVALRPLETARDPLTKRPYALAKTFGSLSVLLPVE